MNAPTYQEMEDMFAEMVFLFPADKPRFVTPRMIVNEVTRLVEQEKHHVERLQIVLYLLMRNDVPTGVLAKQVQEVREVEKEGGAEFTSEHLAAYAEELAHRILEGTG